MAEACCRADASQPVARMQWGMCCLATSCCRRSSPAQGPFNLLSSTLMVQERWLAAYPITLSLSTPAAALVICISCPTCTTTKCFFLVRIALLWLASSYGCGQDNNSPLTFLDGLLHRVVKQGTSADEGWCRQRGWSFGMFAIGLEIPAFCAKAAHPGPGTALNTLQLSSEAGGSVAPMHGSHTACMHACMCLDSLSQMLVNCCQGLCIACMCTYLRSSCSLPMRPY